MDWDEKNKKRLQELLGAKLKEIASPLFPPDPLGNQPGTTMNDLLIRLAPSFEARDAQYDQFFADFGIECAPWLAKTEGRVILDTIDISGALKGPKLSIPKEIAEKFLVLGIP